MSDKSTKEILQNTFGHLDTVVREKRKKKTREDSDSRPSNDQAQKQEKEQVADCESSK